MSSFTRGRLSESSHFFAGRQKTDQNRQSHFHTSTGAAGHKERTMSLCVCVNKKAFKNDKENEMLALNIAKQTNNQRLNNTVLEKETH